MTVQAAPAVVNAVLEMWRGIDTRWRFGNTTVETRSVRRSLEELELIAGREGDSFPECLEEPLQTVRTAALNGVGVVPLSTIFVPLISLVRFDEGW